MEPLLLSEVRRPKAKKHGYTSSTLAKRPKLPGLRRASVLKPYGTVCGLYVVMGRSMMLRS